MQAILNAFSRLGPLAPAVFFFVAGALCFAVGRVVLLGVFHSSVGDVDALYRVFPVGLRMDSVLLSLALFVPSVLLLLLPKGGGRWIRPLFATYFVIFAGLFVFIELASGPFLQEFGSRPNQLFFQNYTHPREILGMAWREYGVDWVQLDAPRHLYLHSVDSLRTLAAQAGLRLDAVQHDSTAFQFWGSEQYRQGIALRDPRSLAQDPASTLFTGAELAAYERRAQAANAAQAGDQAAFYLQRA